MSEILFIRHAETDMAGTFCGHSDPEVNKRGQREIVGLVNDLLSEKIHAVYSSDLRRAQTTAQAIADALMVEVHLRPALREINFGRWECLTWKEIEEQDALYAARWITEYPNLPAPDGETFEEFERRVLCEVEFLIDHAQSGCIAVVTHAGVLRTILSRLCECSEQDAGQQTKSYCCIVRYKCELPSSANLLEVGP